MIAANPKAGAGARSPFQVPPGGWLAVLKRTWGETSRDNVGLIAAGVAFYAFSAIVPLLAAVVLSYGLIADPDTVRQHLEGIFAAVPQEAATLITDQLVNVAQTSEGKQGFGLVIALLIALYGATKGASAIVTALDIAYEETEDRGFLRLNALYFAIVLGGIAMIFLAVATTTLLGFLESLIPGAPGVVIVAIRIVGYLILGALVVTAAAVLYRFGPAHRQPSWVWLSPGSLFATVLWLVGTSAFGIYVSNFGNYGATYGSLSAVIVMLTWLWLSAFVFLLGAELNAELERQVDGRGDDPHAQPGAKKVEPGASDDQGQAQAAAPTLPARPPHHAVAPASPLPSATALAGIRPLRSGLAAVAGFALLRRGKLVGAVLVAAAAAAAYRKPPEPDARKRLRQSPPA